MFLKIIAQNKKARHEYYILETLEAGIVLKGTEIKSIRQHKVSLQDAYCTIKKDELFIIGMHVAKYKQGNIFNHDERRTRKLLLHKQEIRRLKNKLKGESLTIIPTKIYISNGYCKIEIAVAKGKKQYDKRQALKERDMKRQLEQLQKYQS